MAGRFDIVMGVVPPGATSLLDLPRQVAAGGIAAGLFAVASQAPRRLVAPAALVGAVGLAVWFVLRELSGAPAAAAAGAAIVIGGAAHVLALRLKAPPLALLVPGIVPLLPGLTIYRGMLLLNEGASASGLLAFLQAATIGLALAAGALLGEVIGQPVRRELDRFERRITGPRLVGPSRRRARQAPGRPAPHEPGVAGPGPDGGCAGSQPGNGL